MLELISYGATLREFNVALTKIPSTDKGGFLGAVSDLWKHHSLVQNFLRRSERRARRHHETAGGCYCRRQRSRDRSGQQVAGGCGILYS